MKSKLMTILGLCLLALPQAHAQQKLNMLEDILAREAKVVPVQAEYDAAVAAGTLTPELTNKLKGVKFYAEDRFTPFLGEGWRARWQASELADPDEELVAMYKTNPFPLLIPGKPTPNLFTFIGVPAKTELLQFISTKPTLTVDDFHLVRLIGLHHPGIPARLPELAAFLPSGSIRGEAYYEYRNRSVLARPGTWLASMKVTEWIDLAMQPAHFSTTTFTAGRDKVMLKLARLLIEKRTAAGLSTEGAEFDAAFAPVVTALKAPKFSGLRDAVIALELPITIPAELNWGPQEAAAAVVQEAAERNGSFVTSWGVVVPYTEGLGSVMFIKGEAAYETWRQATIAND